MINLFQKILFFHNHIENYNIPLKLKPSHNDENGYKDDENRRNTVIIIKQDINICMADEKLK